MKNKKGVFFLIDVLVALVIIVSGFILIQSSTSMNETPTQPLKYSEEIIYYFSYLSLNEFTTTHIVNLIDNKNFDEDSRIGDVVAYYCYTDNKTAFNNMIDNSIDKIIPGSLDYMIKVKYYNLTECLSYNSDRIGGLTRKKEAKVVSVSRGIVSNKINATELIGPYLVEVTVW